MLKNLLVVVMSRINLFWLISASKFLFQKNYSQFTIVSGADTSHFKSLFNLLNSIEKFDKEAKVSVWDLGLTEDERSKINLRFPNYKLNKFDFNRFPDHFNIKLNAGEYAWKPAIIFEEFNRCDGLLLWLDAGDLLTAKLNWIKKFIKSKGFYSPFSAGTLIEWTYPNMLQRFKISSRDLHNRNLNGAIIGFDTSHTNTKKLVEAWFECAMDKNCIAPIGSGRNNHRQDQAALTCLAYNFSLAPKGLYAVNRKYLGIKQHQDV